MAVAVALVGLTLAGCGSDDVGKSDDLVGTWVPTDVPSVEFGSTFDAADAKITFAADGTWTASDSCNDLSGSYSLDGDGSFDAESQGSAVVGCGGGQIPYDVLLAETADVDIDGTGAATFESSDGKMLLTLDPA